MSNIAQTPYQRWALAGLAAATLLGSAACAATPAPAPGADGGDPAETSAAETSAPAGDTASTPAGEAPAGDGAYADGTFTATGSYQTPGGEESIGVTLTVEADTVTDVQTEPMPGNATTEEFQGKFSSGIKDQIVGTPLDELNVSKVSGSSLTSGGFNAAVEQIKSEAAQ